VPLAACIIQYMERSGKLAHSKRETANLLGISERMVAQLVAARKIRSFRIGRRVLVLHSALLEFLNQIPSNNTPPNAIEVAPSAALPKRVGG
jgi:excisionase family DNA binding protein